VKSRFHHIRSANTEQTRRYGARLGRYVEPGSVIALVGELGSGKTCLTQGIAEGLAVPDGYTVTSPTFAIINEYPGRLTLYHVDLYRIIETSELEETGLEEMLTGDGVTVIEWADKLPEVLPPQRLDAHISVVDETTREICLTAYGQDVINWTSKIFA
jgi:tRNA threonylcarbamoyladenosine biosynthesis protein TsaE